MGHPEQQRFKLLAPPQVAPGGERTEGIAVIALPARDDLAAPGLPDFDEILARELERRLHRLRATGAEIHPFYARGRIFDQLAGQAFHGLVGEKRSVRERQLIQLCLDRVDHRAIAVAQAGDGCPAAGVEIALAIQIDDVRPVAADCNRIFVFRIAVENLAHGDLSLRACFGMTETSSDLGEYEGDVSPHFAKHSQGARRASSNWRSSARGCGSLSFSLANSSSCSFSSRSQAARSMLVTLAYLSAPNSSPCQCKSSNSDIQPSGVSMAWACPWQRPTIQLSTRMFSPNPGQTNFPFASLRNQLT